jgi:hypothetical protein
MRPAQATDAHGHACYNALMIFILHTVHRNDVRMMLVLIVQLSPGQESRYLWDS